MRYLLLAATLLVTPVYADWQCKDQGIGIEKSAAGKLDVSQVKTGAESLPPLSLNLTGRHLKSCTHVGCWAGNAIVTQSALLVHAHGWLTWNNPKDTGMAHFQLTINANNGLGVLMGDGITPLLCKQRL